MTISSQFLAASPRHVGAGQVSTRIHDEMFSSHKGGRGHEEINRKIWTDW